MASLPAEMLNVLRRNKARILDLFRALDVNRDGVITQQEFAMGMAALGLPLSAKEVDYLFDVLDVSDDNRATYEELKAMLNMKELASADAYGMAKIRDAKMRAKDRKTADLDAAVMNEALYAFEQRHGIGEEEGEEGAGPPVSSVLIREQKEDEKRRDRLARRAEESESKRKQRNGQMTSIDTIYIKPISIRPDTAPAREARAARAQKKNEDLYAMWYNKYREEAEHHERLVAHARADAIREQKERVANRRNGLRAVLHERQETSKLNAVERAEPFWKRREKQISQANYKLLQRHRALSQDIVFLPQNLSSPSLTPDRYASDWEDSRHQVWALKDYGGHR